MTTIRMRSIWAEWNADHTSLIAWGTSDLEWVGGRTLSYSYDEGWSGGSPPPVTLFPRPAGVRFDVGDGSVRFITDLRDGTSNTVFFGETGGDAPFSGAVWGIADHSTGREYFVGLNGLLPNLEQLSDGSVRTFFDSLRTGGEQILTDDFGAGTPIIMDGTSNTILVTENDSYSGGIGADSWRAGVGRDTLHGGGGDDELHGERGSDRLYGEDGSDTLTGGGETDYVNGGAGQDLLYGGIGNDRLFGMSGNDRLFGGDVAVVDVAGNDDLFGGSGNDSLYGGAGLDIVDGGAGSDLLILGAGADAIVFARGSGSDRVADFSVVDGDILQLNANLLAGQTTGLEVILAFGTVRTLGRFVLDFGNGDVIDISAASGTSLALLPDQIVIF